MGEYEDDARHIIGKVLGVPVVQNDHNVGRSIPDLYIDYPDGERAYVEVVADSAQKAWRYAGGVGQARGTAHDLR